MPPSRSTIAPRPPPASAAPPPATRTPITASTTATPFSGAGAHGALTLNAVGSYSYTVTNLSGPTGSHLHDVFTYGVSDGHGGVGSANLDITLNRAPIAVNDSATATTGIGGSASG